MQTKDVRPMSMVDVSQQSAAPVIEQLNPPQRVAVVMALLALVLTGLFLVTIAMLGGHWVRRLARHMPGKHRATNAAEAARQNRMLRESLRSVLPDVPTEDTIHFESTKETKVDS
jgi:hypothetical protein